MKQLLRIALSQMIMSLIPILSWYELAICLNDERWSQMFIIAYNQQFVWLVIHGLIIIGTIKYSFKHKQEKEGYIESSIIIATLIMLCESIILSANINVYLEFMHIEEFYSLGIIIYIMYLSIDMMIIGLSDYLNYFRKEKLSNELMFKVYIIRVIGPFIVSRITQNSHIVTLVPLVLTYIYTIYLYKIHTKFKIKNFKLNVFKGIKIVAYNNISDIFMAIIYTLGISNLSSMSASALIAYNMMSSCTDTQWDTLYNAIDTYSSIEVLKTNKVSSKIIKHNIILSILLLISSTLMILISRILFTFDIKLTLTYFIIECSTFIVYAYRYSINSWLALNNIGTIMCIIQIALYIVRTTVSLCCKSIYSLSMAVLVTSLIGNTIYILIYRYKQKIKST